MRCSELTLLSAALFLCLSCNRTGNLHNTDLYYFPEKNVYYDAKSAVFYYSIDSAATWDSMPYLDNDAGNALGLKMLVKRQGKHAWSNNDSLRKATNGVLINLLNQQTFLLARADSIRRIKPEIIAKPKPFIKKDTLIEEPKKGLKKFFNKLFGNKKDKKD